MSLTISPVRIVEESGSPLLAAPDSWPRRALGDVATILNGFAFRSASFSNHEGKPLIRIRDIFNESTAVGFVGDFDDRYLVQRGDVLVGMDGDFNCARWRGPEALLNQRVCKITPDSNQLSVDFLIHVLPGYLQAIHDVTSSTTVTHLSSRDVCQIPIPVPSLSEQKLVATVLNSIADRTSSARTHLTEAARTVDRFRLAVLSDACFGGLTAEWRATTYTDSPKPSPCASSANEAGSINEYSDLDIPERWSVVPLGQVLESLKYGTSQRSEYSNTGKPVLRIPNVSGGRLDLSDLKFADLHPAEVDQLALRLGDLLMVRSNGSVDLLGRTVEVTEEAVGLAYAGYLIRLRVKAKCIDPRYLNLVLATPQLRSQIEIPARSTSGVHNINTQEIRRLGIPLPSLDEQAEIVRRADLLAGLVDGVVRRIAAAHRTVDGVSHASRSKAFRGELAGLGASDA